MARSKTDSTTNTLQGDLYAQRLPVPSLFENPHAGMLKVLAQPVWLWIKYVAGCSDLAVVSLSETSANSRLDIPDGVWHLRA